MNEKEARMSRAVRALSGLGASRAPRTRLPARIAPGDVRVSSPMLQSTISQIGSTLNPNRRKDSDFTFDIPAPPEYTSDK